MFPQTPLEKKQATPWRFCIAPMMEWSDKHCRYFWRLLSKNTLLYTEMVTTGALIHGDRDRFLNYNQEEHPIALQLGGHDADDLAHCASLAEQWGYDEVNLNCGCPSDRVQSGKIGAILMAEPEEVAKSVKAMIERCSIPVTVKHRIGFDDMDDYDDMKRFVSCIAEVGCKTFIVHARKAWLKGLSPKENREIPPLMYENVFRLKEEFPELTIVINGGITTAQQSLELLREVDGVMIGREAYHNPFFLHEIDHLIYGDEAPSLTRREVLEQFITYCDAQLAKNPQPRGANTRLHHMSRHILGLYQGRPRARLFRRHISEHACKQDATTEVLKQALEIVEGQA